MNAPYGNSSKTPGQKAVNVGFKVAQVIDFVLPLILIGLGVYGVQGGFSPAAAWVVIGVGGAVAFPQMLTALQQVQPRGDDSRMFFGLEPWVKEVTNTNRSMAGFWFLGSKPSWDLL